MKVKKEEGLKPQNGNLRLCGLQIRDSSLGTTTLSRAIASIQLENWIIEFFNLTEDDISIKEKVKS